MVYLLIMQLKNRLPPEKVISTLFLSLVIPITVAVMQMFLPSLLPAFLSPIPGDAWAHLLLKELESEEPLVTPMASQPSRYTVHRSDLLEA